MKLNIENRLIERGFGNYEGQSKVEFRKYWNFESNMSDNGVESIKELFERVYVLLKELNDNEIKELSIVPKTRSETYEITGKLNDYKEGESFFFRVPLAEESPVLKVRTAIRPNSSTAAAGSKFSSSFCQGKRIRSR